MTFTIASRETKQVSLLLCYSACPVGDRIKERVYILEDSERVQQYLDSRKEDKKAILAAVESNESIEYEERKLENQA